VVVDWNGVDGVVQFVVGLTKENVTVEMVDVGLPKRVDVTTVVNWIEVDGVVQKKVSASLDDPNSLKLMYKINNKRVIFLKIKNTWEICFACFVSRSVLAKIH